MLIQSITLCCYCLSMLLRAGLRMMNMTDDLVVLLLPSAFLFLSPNIGITSISLLIKSDICSAVLSFLMIALSDPLIVAI